MKKQNKVANGDGGTVSEVRKQARAGPHFLGTSILRSQARPRLLHTAVRGIKPVLWQSAAHALSTAGKANASFVRTGPSRGVLARPGRLTTLDRGRPPRNVTGLPVDDGDSHDFLASMDAAELATALNSARSSASSAPSSLGRLQPLSARRSTRSLRSASEY